MKTHKKTKDALVSAGIVFSVKYLESGIFPEDIEISFVCKDARFAGFREIFQDALFAQHVEVFCRAVSGKPQRRRRFDRLDYRIALDVTEQF